MEAKEEVKEHTKLNLKALVFYQFTANYQSMYCSQELIRKQTLLGLDDKDDD